MLQSWKRLGDTSYHHLRRTHRRRRRQGRYSRDRGRLPGRIHIARRPQPVAGRTRFGDWRRIWSALREARRRLSCKERKSRFLLPGKAQQNKTAAALGEASAPGLCEQPPALRQALAPDNGSKMVQFKELESATDLRTSFCAALLPKRQPLAQDQGRTAREGSRTAE